MFAPGCLLHWQAVIDFKWSTWAKRLLYAEFAAYLLWLICFQAFTILFQANLPAPFPLSPYMPQFPADFQIQILTWNPICSSNINIWSPLPALLRSALP